jgi:chromosome segregation ATPase
VLEHLTELQKQSDELTASLGELRRTEQRLRKGITEGAVEEEEKEKVLRGLSDSLQQLEVVIHRTKMVWKEQYEPYFKPEALETKGVTGASYEELTGRFRLWKQKMSGVEENIEKQKLLRQTLTESMERLMESIRERGQSMEELAAAERRGEILPGERSGLAGDEALLQEMRERLKQKQAALSESSAQVQHLAGSIEYAI